MKKELAKDNKQHFSEVLQQIQTAKQRAFQQVNKTLVQLYWNIGNYVSEQVKIANWGKSTVEQLAVFIKQNEPNVSGFTTSNIWRMKQFYETYGKNEKLATLWRELSWTHNRSLSPTVIADYETKLIPKELLRRKLNELYAFLERAFVRIQGVVVHFLNVLWLTGTDWAQKRFKIII